MAGRTSELAGTLVHEVDQPLAELLVKLTHRGLLSALDYHDLGRHSSCASILWRPLATFLHLWLLK